MSGIFDTKVIEQVWNKGVIVDGYDQTLFRKDCCGAWIVKSEYGKTGPFGWEIDHVFPQVKGGSEDLVNLRPMQWENNRSKSDDYPNYDSAISADENRNVRKVGPYYVNEKLQKALSRLYNI